MIAFAAWFDAQLPPPARALPVSFAPALTIDEP